MTNTLSILAKLNWKQMTQSDREIFAGAPEEAYIAETESFMAVLGVHADENKCQIEIFDADGDIKQRFIINEEPV